MHYAGVTRQKMVLGRRLRKIETTNPINALNHELIAAEFLATLCGKMRNQANSNVWDGA
jgi:hypothetical protein